MIGVAGGIRVVDEVDFATEALFEELLRLEADPGVRHVRGRQGPALDDDGGKAYADGLLLARGIELLEDLLHRVQDVLRFAARRCRNLHPVGEQLARVDIDDRALDPGAADVDAYRFVGHV
jgi:hypothetical protein